MSPRRALWNRLFGDRVARADLYLQSGKLAKAAQEYARAGRFDEAARVAAKAGEVEAAMAYFEQGGFHFEAAELMESEGYVGESVDSFLAAKMPLRAAAAATAARQHLRAASIYEESGHHREAAAAYEIADDHEGVLRCLEGEAGHLEQPQDRQRLLDNGVRRARALTRVGRVHDAALLLKEMNHPGAAELFAQAGNEDEAVSAFLQSGGVSEAQRIAENPAIDQAVRSRVLSHPSVSSAGRPEDWRERAALLEKEGELRQAADLWLENGEPSRAASLLERVGDVESAALAYSSAGDMVGAARCFDLAGKPRRAAGCLLLANQPVDAAAAFLAVSDVRSAIAAVNSVDPVDPGYEAATLLLAPALHAAGEWDELLERLAQIPQLGSSKESVLERRYWEGRTLLSAQRVREARRSLQAVVEIEPRFRDARRWLREADKIVLEADRAAATQRVPGIVAIGDVLAGRYEVQERIGQGGMSVIFRARDLQSGGLVALKTLVASTQIDPLAEERLLREAKLCQRIQHENVVQIFDLGRFEHGVFVTMELLQGLTLETLISEKRVFASSEAISILEDVLAGLEAVHAASVIHRDIKPANLAVTPDCVKIMDFGIALAPGLDVALTQPGQVMGSPMYMSPEQIQGLELDPRSDLYSFGVVCFTLLAGREPFPGKTPADVVLKHLQDAPPDLLAMRPDVPEELVGLIESLLSKNPEARPQSAAIVMQRIRAIG